LFLTLVVAGVGIAVSLPVGIVFALGRRSEMPAVRAISIGFIELWRGVPLITVLFMSSVMLPLFLPEGVNFDKLLRALIGVALFSSAYMAEVVRGGLQAIPKGQYEAAASMGLGYWQMMRLIILPQALKLVIPGIVNTFIGLFKDTTLVLIIGLFDLLGSVQAATTDPKWVQHLHRAVQGHNPRADHRAFRPAGQRTGRDDRSEMGRHVRRRLRLHRHGVLDFLLQHVALQHAYRAEASYRPQALVTGSTRNV
jgi:His/Glu/Gln/Arg/opine family amino acid ABC transporter permease subunit